MGAVEEAEFCKWLLAMLIYAAKHPECFPIETIETDFGQIRVIPNRWADGAG